jgi:hypothetical protein
MRTNQQSHARDCENAGWYDSHNYRVGGRVLLSIVFTNPTPELILTSVLIPVLSLIVAALAVFFGPLITLKISRKQFELSRRIADKQIIAPMRQAWIEKLRGENCGTDQQCAPLLE